MGQTRGWGGRVNKKQHMQKHYSLGQWGQGERERLGRQEKIVDDEEEEREREMREKRGRAGLLFSMLKGKQKSPTSSPGPNTHTNRHTDTARPGGRKE